MSMQPPHFDVSPDNRDGIYGKVTMADVAMKVVQDGPIYAILVLVGVAFFRGNASATEMIMSAAMGLLARAWPKPVQVKQNGGSGGP